MTLDHKLEPRLAFSGWEMTSGPGTIHYPADHQLQALLLNGIARAALAQPGPAPPPAFSDLKAQPETCIIDPSTPVDGLLHPSLVTNGSSHRLDPFCQHC